ncbi:hypothetical protein V1478_014048 [Vespula squamosa]|uniref:Uncharacterized protein n=1 Tax=Vespula squamosa TaxID=30214 RepID=A0ABD2A6W2_VESSQ
MTAAVRIGQKYNSIIDCVAALSNIFGEEYDNIVQLRLNRSKSCWFIIYNMNYKRNQEIVSRYAPIFPLVEE